MSKVSNMGKCHYPSSTNINLFYQSRGKRFGNKEEKG